MGGVEPPSLELDVQQPPVGPGESVLDFADNSRVGRGDMAGGWNPNRAEPAPPSAGPGGHVPGLEGLLPLQVDPPGPPQLAGSQPTDGEPSVLDFADSSRVGRGDMAGGWNPNQAEPPPPSIGPGGQVPGLEGLLPVQIDPPGRSQLAGPAATDREPSVLEFADDSRVGRGDMAGGWNPNQPPVEEPPSEPRPPQPSQTDGASGGSQPAPAPSTASQASSPTASPAQAVVDAAVAAAKLPDWAGTHAPALTRDALRDRFAGTFDIAGAAEQLVREGFIEYDQATPQSLSVIATKAGLPSTLDVQQAAQTTLGVSFYGTAVPGDVLYTTRMNCYEFVHLAGYISSDAGAKPSFSFDTNLVLDPSTIKVWDGKSAIPRGKVIVGCVDSAVKRWWVSGEGKNGEYHFGVSLGNGMVASNHGGGPQIEKLNDVFSVGYTSYSRVIYGDYKPHTAPVPQGPPVTPAVTTIRSGSPLTGRQLRRRIGTRAGAAMAVVLAVSLGSLFAISQGGGGRWHGRRGQRRAALRWFKRRVPAAARFVSRAARPAGRAGRRRHAHPHTHPADLRRPAHPDSRPGRFVRRRAGIKRPAARWPTPGRPRESAASRTAARRPEPAGPTAAARCARRRHRDRAARRTRSPAELALPAAAPAPSAIRPQRRSRSHSSCAPMASTTSLRLAAKPASTTRPPATST